MPSRHANETVSCWIDLSNDLVIKTSTEYNDILWKYFSVSMAQIIANVSK